MKLILGLGNPGMTYAQTRHNVGFMIVARLAGRHGANIDRHVVGSKDRRPCGVYGSFELKGAPVVLLMPLTMMNASGLVLKEFDLPPDELLVIMDDVNLPLGQLRIRPKGGSGGHHGLESCQKQLGTEEVSRLRVGVGCEPLPRDLSDFVLSSFAKEEKPLLETVIDQAADACESWVINGMEVTMNRYNGQGPDLGS